MSTLVVVGASLAGLRAVETARREGHTGRVVLVGAEEHLPYDRPPLSKDGLAPGDDVVPHLLDEAGMSALDVDLRLGTPATGLDVEGRSLHLGDDALPYDALVVATGAHARSLPSSVPGHDLPHVRVLRTLDDSRAVRSALDAGARTVVVGAGFIGSEVASAVRARGLPVTLLEAAPQPLVRALGEQVAGLLSALHPRHGTDLRLGTTVVEVRPDTVLLSDGTGLPADLVVVGAGATPTTGWLAGSGLVLDDGVLCDATLQAGPGVWAAGDVARWRTPDGGSRRLEHWTAAAEQGALAARNAVTGARQHLRARALRLDRVVRHEGPPARGLPGRGRAPGRRPRGRPVAGALPAGRRPGRCGHRGHAGADAQAATTGGAAVRRGAGPGPRLGSTTWSPGA